VSSIGVPCPTPGQGTLSPHIGLPKWPNLRRGPSSTPPNHGLKGIIPWSRGPGGAWGPGGARGGGLGGGRGLRGDPRMPSGRLRAWRKASPGAPTTGCSTLVVCLRNVRTRSAQRAHSGDVAHSLLRNISRVHHSKVPAMSQEPENNMRSNLVFILRGVCQHGFWTPNSARCNSPQRSNLPKVPKVPILSRWREKTGVLGVLGASK